MSAHWLVTGALLADLYRRYCNDDDNPIHCDDVQRRFTALTVMSFICAGGWVSVGVLMYVHIMQGCRKLLKIGWAKHIIRTHLYGKNYNPME